MTEEVYGDKSKFAIYIKESTKPKKFYLKYFFNGITIGSLKRSDYLDSSIDNFFKLINRFDNLWEDKFEFLTYREIFNDIYLTFDHPSLEQENIYVERMNRFDFYDEKLGNSLTVGCYNNKKGKIIFLIYKMDGKINPKFYSFEIEFDYFKQVYLKFIDHARKSNLLKS